MVLNVVKITSKNAHLHPLVGHQSWPVVDAAPGVGFFRDTSEKGRSVDPGPGNVTQGIRHVRMAGKYVHCVE